MARTYSLEVELSAYPGRSVTLGPRARLWAIGLLLIGIAPVGGAIANGFHDWPAFWSAGATAGTPDLLDPARHGAWQAAHGLPQAFFPYPPGSAWLFVPLAALPLGIGFAINGIVALAMAAAAGLILARTMGIPDPTGILAALAFAPVTASIVLGQNATLGLLLVAIAIACLAGDRQIAAGIAVGLLLYKPTYAVPMLGLLLVRRQWRALAAAGIVAIGWYAASAVAAGDWLWPGPWLDGLRGYLDADFAGNADKAISLPGLLARLPVSPWLPILSGVALVLVALPRLARAPVVDAAVGASLIGVAASPHAWGYDAALVVPAVVWLLAGNGPWTGPTRSRLLLIAYALGPLWLVSRQTIVSAVAVVVLGGVVLWLVRPRDPVAVRPAEAPA